MKATSRITNAIADIPKMEYIARRPESTHSPWPERAPYSDAPNP